MAEQSWPSLRVIALIVVAGAGARTVALVLNRVIDRHIDRGNPRTKERHLASGAMKIWEAVVIAVAGMAVYLWAAWMLSDFCLKLAWIPIVAFTAYPYFKRFTKWAHVGLGFVWSLVPIGGFFAVKPSLEGIGPVLMLALFSVFWLAGFDIIYAMQDEEYDREAGLHSLPARLGGAKAIRISAIFHLCAFIVLVFLYGAWLAGPITVMLLAIAGVLLFFEQYYSRYVDFAFFYMNILIGFVVFLFVISGVKGV